MAQADIDIIRFNTDATQEEYPSVDLQKMLDAGMSVNDVSRSIWVKRAAQYSGLVDTSESGSSRKLSDLHKNALTMADRFKDADDFPSEPIRRKGTRNAVRS